MRKISVVQWALRLPSRQLSLSITNGEECSKSCLDEESGAIVPVGLETSASLNSPEQNLIGRGGSSQVYKGCLPDGQELAVKILKPSEDVIKEFVLEIEIITALHHKNIISLLGFCFEDNKHLLLVYDLLSRGSLEENLHEDAAFGWTERYRVAVGVAEALDYLHNTSDRPVIHRDVKSSNILLSEDFEPQLSDFGLAKWASTSSTHIVCTDVAGTFGYLAPEYFMYGKVNDKIDVYAFGVVLLELISGRKPISNDLPKGQESVVMWARPILHGGKISQLLDQSLGSDYDHEEIHRMVLAATLSIRRDPRARPPMSTVLKLLKGDTEVTKWAKQEVNVIVEDSDSLDEGVSPRSDLKSHLNLALLDVEDDSLSTGSIEQNLSLEEYLQGRWSRSSSFD
ncbi:Protein kinase STUNTED [Linum perenne]